MLWYTLAVVIGLAAGMAVNMALILLNSKVLYPAPDGLDFKDKAGFQAYVDTHRRGGGVRVGPDRSL